MYYISLLVSCSPVFKNLKNLKVLGLRGNSIAHIPTDAFSGLSTLHVMDLSHQELRALEEYYFTGTAFCSICSSEEYYIIGTVFLVYALEE
jgi:hypothetical protein